MKKKTIITLTLGAFIALGSIGGVFAAEVDNTTVSQTFARGNGLRMYTNASSVEELLKQKVDLIDQMVKDGRLTEEAAENYKKLITERMENCTTIGENRNSNERLGIGFGRGMGLGNNQGQGMGKGLGFRRNFSSNN
jgi:hypothetical protein